MLDFQKKKQLGILVKIAMVDEEFAESEKSVILKIGQRYGASEDEIKEIFDSPPINESLAPMTVTDKMDFMMDCVLVAMADEIITTSEESFMSQMAMKLGFDHGVIKFLLNNKDASRNEMRELMLHYFIQN